jgi:phage terminase small subunit
MAEQATLQAAFDAALAELPERHQQLVHQYLVDLHQKNAALRAGYTPEHASKILRNLKVQAAIDAGMSLYAMPVPELLHRIAGHARGDMSDFFTIAEEDVVIDRYVNGIVTTTETVRRTVARLDFEKAASEGKLHLIKAYSRTDKGERAEIYDAHAAQALLARIHGLLVDRTEITGKDGGDLIIRTATAALDKAYGDSTDNPDPAT